MVKPVVAITPPPPDPREEPVVLFVRRTPAGVLIDVDGALAADTPHATVARTLCRFADGLLEGGKPVRLTPQIVQAAL